MKDCVHAVVLLTLSGVRSGHHRPSVGVVLFRWPGRTVQHHTLACWSRMLSERKHDSLHHINSGAVHAGRRMTSFWIRGVECGVV